MKIFNLIIFLLCMPYATLVPTTPDEQIAEASQYLNEYIHYLDELQKATQFFEQKYNDEPKFQCTNCSEKKLSYGEIVGWIIGQSMAALENVDKFNEAKKILLETIEGLLNKTPDELSDFMLSTANNLQVKCSHCQANHWTIITAIKK